ncbi:MAG: glycosyltransferase family A protein [Coleofasciculaceae cyanobacterium]
MPKVTVVIPAYNAMRYLPETMETALAQTFTDFEVLVVNDGSTDNTAEWVSQVTDPRVRIVSQENKGLAGARNTGIAHAKGEYIAYLDADDLWEPTKLEKQVRCLDENPEVGLVYTWTALADQYGKSTGRVISSHAEGNVWHELIEFNMVCCGSTPLIRRSCFDVVGLFSPDVSPSDDWDMWLRIANKFSFGVVKEALIRYRQHPSNSSKNFQLMLDTSRTLIERTFASAPTESLYLRNRSYGSIYLYLGWRAIENTDYKQAMHFRQQACAHRPQFYFSPRCIRLGVAITLMRWFGTQTYSRALAVVYALRRGLISAGR